MTGESKTNLLMLRFLALQSHSVRGVVFTWSSLASQGKSLLQSLDLSLEKQNV